MHTWEEVSFLCTKINVPKYIYLSLDLLLCCRKNSHRSPTQIAQWDKYLILLLCAPGPIITGEYLRSNNLHQLCGFKFRSVWESRENLLNSIAQSSNPISLKRCPKQYYSCRIDIFLVGTTWHFTNMTIWHFTIQWCSQPALTSRSLKTGLRNDLTLEWWVDLIHLDLLS